MPERLSRSRALLGLVQTSASELLVKLAEGCGYDFLFIDREHGTFREHEYLQAVESVASSNVLTLARLADHDTEAVRRFATAGADAIVVPHVSDAAQARALARAMVDSPRRAGLLVVIESMHGVENAGAIFAVDGVDGAFIGPTDLSTDLGRRGDYANPAYEDALSRVERAAAAAGKLLGTAVVAGYPLEALVARGHRLLVLGTDASLIREAMAAQVTRARSRL